MCFMRCLSKSKLFYYRPLYDRPLYDRCLELLWKCLLFDVQKLYKRSYYFIKSVTNCNKYSEEALNTVYSFSEGTSSFYFITKKRAFTVHAIFKIILKLPISCVVKTPPATRAGRRNETQDVFIRNQYSCSCCQRYTYQGTGSPTIWPPKDDSLLFYESCLCRVRIISMETRFCSRLFIKLPFRFDNQTLFQAFLFCFYDMGK